MVSMMPVKFAWDGVVMSPVRGYQSRAAEQFKSGEVYTLEVREERSSAQHRQYFAAINEAFQNLAEEVGDKIKTPNHLRKWALIETGWFDETQVDCGTKEVALRMATLLHQMDEYCEFRIRDNILVKRTAKSQKQRAMDKEDFSRSSREVLDLLSDMTGVNRTLLERYARRRTA